MMVMVQKHQHGGDLNLAIKKYNLDPAKIIDFSVNTNPLGPPEVLCDLMRDGLHYATVYPDPFAEVLKDSYASLLGIRPGQLIFSNGAVELIYLAVQALCPKSVLIPCPTFREYEIAARAFGASIKTLRLSPEKGFLPTLGLLQRAARGVDLVFLCTPNNPTGNLLPPDILKPFLEFCAAEGTFVMVDESFLFFHDLWRELSVVGETTKYKNLLVLHSLTKFFAIPGLRVGYGAAHPDTITMLGRFQPPWQVNGLAHAAAAAVVHEQEYADRSRAFIEHQRTRLAEALSSLPGIKVYPAEANYLLLELTGALTAPALADALAGKGVLVRDCSNFPFLGNRYIRVAVKDQRSSDLLVSLLKDLI